MMGVAIGVQGVQQQIAELRQRLATVGRPISAALGLLASAPPEPSPDRVIQVLSPASEQVGSAFTGLNGAAQQVEQVQQQALATLAGGDPGPLVQSLGQVKQVALELAQRCADVRQTVDQTIQQARHTGRSGN
jgi:ABC-type transporter Mla subunit MlaD